MTEHRETPSDGSACRATPLVPSAILKGEHS